MDKSIPYGTHQGPEGPYYPQFDPRNQLHSAHNMQPAQNLHRCAQHPNQQSMPRQDGLACPQTQTGHPHVMNIAPVQNSSAWQGQPHAGACQTSMHGPHHAMTGSAFMNQAQTSHPGRTIPDPYGSVWQMSPLRQPVFTPLPPWQQPSIHQPVQDSALAPDTRAMFDLLGGKTGAKKS